MDDIREFEEYERSFAKILEERILVEFPGACLEVYHDRTYPGSSGHQHQIDVSAELTLAGLHFLILVECKRYRDTVSVEDVLTFAQRLGEIRAQKGIIVTPVGFQEGAKKVAQHNHISLWRVSPDSLSSEVLIPALMPILAVLRQIQKKQTYPAEPPVVRICSGAGVCSRLASTLAASFIMSLRNYSGPLEKIEVDGLVRIVEMRHGAGGDQRWILLKPHSSGSILSDLDSGQWDIGLCTEAEYGPRGSHRTYDRLKIGELETAKWFGRIPVYLIYIPGTRGHVRAFTSYVSESGQSTLRQFRR